MEPRLQTGEEISKTLSSIDRISRAEAPSFFYTRVQARLDKGNEAQTAFRMAGKRPVLSLAVLTLLLVLNIAVVRSYLRTKEDVQTQQSASGIQAFAETYDLGASSVFTDKTTDQ